MSQATSTERSVAHLEPGQVAHVGFFKVSRLLPNEAMQGIDPFLFLDFFDAEFPPGLKPPSNAHPHRGFETVTIILKGEVGYRDSLGNKGVLKPGSVEWMSAGSGIVHDGHFDHAFAKTGGRVMGIQLWVNLPAKLKMMEPAARYLAPETFPEAQLEGGYARVLAGSAHGVKSEVETKVPLNLVDYHLEPGARVVVDLPPTWGAFAQVCEGSLRTAGQDAKAGQLLCFAEGGDAVVLEAGAQGVRVVLGSGEPIEEPIVSHGPFVMNTIAQIHDAIADYQAGKMGHLD